MSSGQVFRWREIGDDRWLGVDGANWYECTFIRSPDDMVTYDIHSNATSDQFEALFRLEVSLRETERDILSKGPELGPYIRSLPGLRLLQPTPREALLSFLCTVNNHLKRIQHMVLTLSTYGKPIAGAPRDVFEFPAIERVAAIPESELRAKGFGYRAKTIPDVAAQVAARGGEQWLTILAGKPYEEAHQELVRIKGIGPKLADCICLFALRHMRSVPVDTHIWQSAVRMYFPQWKSASLTPARYREIGDHFRERFGDLTGWAHQYLFYENLLNWRSRGPGNKGDT